MDPHPQIVVAFFNGWEVMVILFVALLLFGSRLPELMRSLGGSVREFKKGMNTDDPPAGSAQPPALPQPPQLPAPPPAAGTVSRDSANTPPTSK
jgi:TatA/E family protein of Tat protein translocase